MRVRALRGATTADSDSREQIIESTTELLEEMLDRNLPLIGSIYGRFLPFLDMFLSHFKPLKAGGTGNH